MWGPCDCEQFHECIYSLAEISGSRYFSRTCEIVFYCAHVYTDVLARQLIYVDPVNMASNDIDNLQVLHNYTVTRSLDSLPLRRFYSCHCMMLTRDRGLMTSKNSGILSFVELIAFDPGQTDGRLEGKQHTQQRDGGKDTAGIIDRIALTVDG